MQKVWNYVWLHYVALFAVATPSVGVCFLWVSGCICAYFLLDLCAPPFPPTHTHTPRISQVLSATLFSTLRDSLGDASFHHLVSAKLEAVAGDVSRPRMGMQVGMQGSRSGGG